MKIHQFATPKDVASNFAKWLFNFVSSVEKDIVHISLSGGSTPKILFQVLAEQYVEDFPWEKIHFWWGDERCVKPTDPDSNFGVVQDLLFNHVDIPKENIHRILGEFDPENEVKRYEQSLESLVDTYDTWPSFDLILLGMGDDGHTASIFPNQMELLTTLDICSIATHPESLQKRITITGNVINHAKNVVFLVTGSSKKDKFLEIQEADFKAKQYPSFYVKPIGNLHWFIDDAVME